MALLKGPRALTVPSTSLGTAATLIDTDPLLKLHIQIHRVGFAPAGFGVGHLNWDRSGLGYQVGGDGGPQFGRTHHLGAQPAIARLNHGGRDKFAPLDR